MTTIFIWFLLTIPHDRIICDLWIKEPPTPEALVQACGTTALGAYRLDVLQNGVGICTVPASSLSWFMDDCGLSGRMDDYTLRIVQPNYQETFCSVTTTTPDAPTKETISQKCDISQPYQLRMAGTRQATPEADSVCTLPSIPQPASIATSYELHLLAGKLIWYGYARSACPNNLSGVDPNTFAATPCGMDGARAEMIAWQNSMDYEIIAAATQWHIPAMMLKDMIKNETQFWGWTGSPQEHGLIQATEYAADAVLGVYSKGYYLLTPTQRENARNEWLAKLDCYHCTPRQAIDHAKQMMSVYAQTLAAYRCIYGSWDDALRAWNIKYQE